MTSESTNHLIHTFLIEPKGSNQSLNKEDEMYWITAGYHPQDIPQKIIIATASTRKLLMSNVLLNFDLNQKTFYFSENVPAEYREVFNGNPIALQQFFLENIPNGNGSYKGGSVLLGYFHGVPVCGECTSGETRRGTDPVKQAVLKARNLAKKYRDSGEHVIIVSGDSVEFVGTNREPHGKPSGDFEFRQRRKYERKEKYEAKKEKAWEKYLEHYVRKTYLKHEVTSSAVGIAAFSLMNDLSRATVERTIVEYFEKYSLDGLELKPDKDAAGGGVSQQLINWESGFVDIPDGEIWKWLIYCHIAGAPIFAMLGAAVEAGSKSSQKLQRRRANL
jgi:hypothetical protein